MQLSGRRGWAAAVVLLGWTLSACNGDDEECPQLAGRWEVMAHCDSAQVGRTWTMEQLWCRLTGKDTTGTWSLMGEALVGDLLTATLTQTSSGGVVTCSGSATSSRMNLHCKSQGCVVAMRRPGTAGPDLSVALDLAAPRDSAVSLDAMPPPDQAPPPDITPPPDQGPPPWFHDTATGLFWQNRGNLPELDFTSALSYCNGLSLGGKYGWRLPTISEARTLVAGCPATASGGSCGLTTSCASSNGCWDKTKCAGCAAFGGPGSHTCYWLNVTGVCGVYWSKTADTAKTGTHWALEYGKAKFWNFPDSTKAYVRCVRP